MYNIYLHYCLRTTLKEEVKPNQMELFGEFMKKFQPNMKMEMNMMPQFMLWNNLLRSKSFDYSNPLNFFYFQTFSSSKLFILALRVISD